MQVWSLGWEDPLEEKMATHSSILAWRTNGQRSLEGFSAQGRRVGCDWSDLACMPQNTHIQIPRTWGYITFHDKRWVEFQTRIEVANHLTLRWGNYPGWSRWAQYNHGNPSAWRGKKWVKERGTTTEAGSERCCYWLRKWRSYKPKWNASGLEKQEKPRKWILPKNLQKGMWPCQTLNFSPGRQVSDF